MVIIKEELEITDADDDSQSNYDVHNTDDEAFIDNEDTVPFRDETFANPQSMVYNRPKVFECYLCKKSWPTVGKMIFDFTLQTIGNIKESYFRSPNVSFRPSSYNGYDFKMSFVRHLVENAKQFSAACQYAFE